MAGAAGTGIDAGAVPCATHPRIETMLRCSDCGTPVCPDCMVQSAVGIKCRDCARLPRSARVALHPARAARGLGAGLAVATVVGVLLAYAGTGRVGLFTFIVAYVVGLVVGRAVVWASGRYRAESTAWIAAGCAAWAYVVPALVIAVATGASLRVGLQLLGVVIAAWSAYREVL